MCSTAFASLGRAQAKALGHPELPILVVPHPFGSLSRARTRKAAEQCVEEIIGFLNAASQAVEAVHRSEEIDQDRIQVENDVDAINRFFRERGWTDGLPVVAPTTERVEHMLCFTSRGRDEVVGMLPPGFGAATVERIAINATMAGCDPECLPVLMAAVEAMASPQFNLQGIQTTTNPAAVWLIVNGPVIATLGMNSGMNCLGQGNWANATLGRALRLIMQNIGLARSGEMDRATIGQPGKYMFCCAENEKENPWEPLHVERGFRTDQSTVTVMGAEGTLNLNTHCKNGEEVLRIFAETLARPSANDYFLCGEPWLIISPETARLLKDHGYSKARVKQRLWQGSRLRAGRMTEIDMNLTRLRRNAELGEITPDTMLPISSSPESIGILVCGGSGTHSMYVPSFGNTRSVTRAVEAKANPR